MFVNESSVRAARDDRPYEEHSFLVSRYRRIWTDRGTQDRPGPYGVGLIQFYTAGVTAAKPFLHTVDVADIILIE